MNEAKGTASWLMCLACWNAKHAHIAYASDCFPKQELADAANRPKGAAH
jgi:hypothetical protein